VIYLTPYDTVTLACTGASTDSGFTTLDEVRQMMGEPDMAHPRMLTYGDSCFTDFVLHVEPTDA
jgi:cystathionine beta-lyase family protein involved in aluminum resistance